MLKSCAQTFHLAIELDFFWVKKKKKKFQFLKNVADPNPRITAGMMIIL